MVMTDFERWEWRKKEERETWISGWKAALDAAASEILCGCDCAEAVVKVGHNSAERWKLCAQPNCAALMAAEIRAMEPPPCGG